ncbi:MAG: glucose-1-phosphate adenylyltransferase [Erysipelotrichaceae bacterium]|nr:glucose-1-phosphate adenylyltransferase [Erysipelotrichaceae bacterium]
MSRNNMVALILAGGRGSRLFDLTKKIAKPAVHFGGKYRIIDFALSNCANSDVDTVGIAVQYESIQLSSYVAHDQLWGLNTAGGGVYVLPPREKEGSGFDIYEGTANAIAQNLDFLDQEKPDYVLVLSGDHIYKMDYREMLQKHVESKADATIAVIEVPMKEASRFGIMNCDEEDRIVEFEEKPPVPKSNLASMGIYIFNYKTMRKYLLEDEKKENSSHDFGKDIIPAYLHDGKKLQAYRFKGYWKDVGTVDSLWEANMDLIDDESELDLFDPEWKIYTDDTMTPPATFGKKASAKKSYITQGCHVDGTVYHSVLFTGTTVSEGAEVRDTVVMNNVKIGKGARLNRCLVMDDLVIPDGMELGDKNAEKVLLVSKKVIDEAGRKQK